MSRPIVLVPTMGALHAGHAALLQKASRAAGKSGSVVVSIFVNPTQFGRGEDFSRYPRTLAPDLALCRSAGVQAVFAPSAASMYSDEGSTTFVDETELSRPLCGKSRPGHFRGVCTVVTKLFNIIRPDAAVFGEKDFQQLAVIRRMVSDLDLPVKIIPCATVREKDGLAMSSRNRMLSAAERHAAPALYGALRNAVANASAPRSIVKHATRLIARIPGARIDYIEAVDAATLLPAINRHNPARLAAAVFFGTTRLIDNIAMPALRGRP